jgi:acetyl esterase/lipase
LAQRGIAVWSIGYRRPNETGGGYPGTFQDVGEAIDRVRSESVHHHLDLTRLVLVGHSAGGHLALWGAARGKLPAASSLYSSNPLVPRSVISLAGIGDLKAFAPLIPGICGPGIAERLIPPTAEPYAEISPAELPPSGVRIVMISGILDRLVPPYHARDYARAMRRRDTPVELVNIPDAGHFDLVAPGTGAWEQVSARIISAVGVVARP